MTIYKFSFDETRVCIEPITVVKKGSLLFTVRDACKTVNDFNILLNDNTMYSKTNTKEDIKFFINALIRKENGEIEKMQRHISDKCKRIEVLKSKRPKETIFRYDIVLTRSSPQIFQCSAAKTELVSVDNDSMYTIITKTPFGEIHDKVLKEQFGKFHSAGYPQGYVCYLQEENDEYFAELCAKEFSLPSDITAEIKKQLLEIQL